MSRHFYPGASERFPALTQIPHLNPLRAILLSGGICTSFISWTQDCVTDVPSDCTWQFLYWKFVLVDRRAKIQSGQRTTSFSYLLNDQRGAIGKSLSAVPPQYREAFFMGGQLGKLIDRSEATLRLITVLFYSLCHFDRTPRCFRLV